MNIIDKIRFRLSRGNGSKNSSGSSGRAARAPSASSAGRSIWSAGDAGRLSASWSGVHVPIDRYVTGYWERIAARAQHEVLHGAHARAFANMCRDNIAGPNGFAIQPQVTDAAGKPDKAANALLSDAWEAWACAPENCSVSGRENMAQLSRLAVMSWVVYGEAFFVFRRGKSASPWGFALQNLDPRRIWVGHNADLGGGRYVKNGIEFDANGRPTAYFARKQLSSVETGTFTFGDCDRIPAADVAHVFIKDFPGQARGISPMAPVLADLHHAGNLDQSMLARANIASNTLGLVSNADSPPPEGFEEYRSEAGTLIDLGNKEFIQSGIDYPDSAYDAFQRAILRRIASGLGVSYNNLASDLTSVNFSSIRQGLLNERAAWEALQAEFISQLMRPLFRAWLETSLLAGKIFPAEKRFSDGAFDRLSAVKFVGRRWTWIDPVSDMTAAEKALAMKIKSRSKIIRELGGDPWSEWAEIAEENAEMDALGLDSAFAPAGATQPAKAKA